MEMIGRCDRQIIDERSWMKKCEPARRPVWVIKIQNGKSARNVMGN